MGLISQLATTIDTSMIDYVQTVFTAVTTPITALLKAVGIVGLLYVGLNQILQFRTIQLSTYLFWIIRYLLIFAFATIWANFKGVYDVFIAIPQDYSALLTKAIAEKMTIEPGSTGLIDPSVITDTYTGMDEFGHAIVKIAYEFLHDLSIFNIGKSIQNIFLGALILIIGGFFLAACAITIIVAKVGFAVAVSLAPLAIVMLMLEQTRNHFDSWMKLAVSFLVLPLLTSALVSIILFLAGQVLKDVDATNVFQVKYLGFLLIMLSALFLLFQLPVMASTLASASVAAAGASTLMAAATKAKSAGRSMMSGVKKAHSAGQRARDAVEVGRNARAAGASKTRTAWSMLNGMRQSAIARQDRRDRRLGSRIVGGQNSPGVTRAERARGGGTGANDGYGRNGGSAENSGTSSNSTDAWQSSPDRQHRPASVEKDVAKTTKAHAQQRQSKNFAAEEAGSAPSVAPANNAATHKPQSSKEKPKAQANESANAKKRRSQPPQDNSPAKVSKTIMKDGMTEGRRKNKGRETPEKKTEPQSEKQG